MQDVCREWGPGNSKASMNPYLFQLRRRRGRRDLLVADGGRRQRRCIRAGPRAAGAAEPRERAARARAARVLPVPVRLGVRGERALAQVHLQELLHHQRQRRRVR